MAKFLGKLICALVMCVGIFSMAQDVKELLISGKTLDMSVFLITLFVTIGFSIAYYRIKSD